LVVTQSEFLSVCEKRPSEGLFSFAREMLESDPIARAVRVLPSKLAVSVK
jgi:hypothetical protein